jgi:hypothetical protein
MPGQAVALCNAITAHGALERLPARDPGNDRTQSLVAVTPDARAVRVNLAPVEETCMVIFKTKKRMWVLSKMGCGGVEDKLW